MNRAGDWLDAGTAVDSPASFQFCSRLCRQLHKMVLKTADFFFFLLLVSSSLYGPEAHNTVSYSELEKSRLFLQRNKYKDGISPRMNAAH